MFALARRNPNALDSRVTPVVFLPGIMGSRLRLEDRDDEGKTSAVNWDPDSLLNMAGKWLKASGDTKAYRFNADNPGSVLDSGNGLNADRCKRGWAGVVADFYLDILKALESGLDSDMFKCPIYAFGYDWRQPNKTSAERLKVRVDEILVETRASSAVLVTHSMGGIVARAAMQDGVFREKKIAGAVHIGQPVLGAPSAYRRLVAGISETLDGDLSRLLRDKAESVGVMSVVPSVFELLPSDATTTTVRAAHEEWMRFREPDTPDVLKTFAASETIHIYMRPHSPPGLAEPGPHKKAIRKHASKGIGFMSPLGTTMHPFTGSIYGDGVETDTRAIFTITKDGLDGASYEPAEGRSEDGDGTVPTWSGQALYPGQAHEASGSVDPEAQSQWVVRGETHDVMCNSSEVQETTVQFIHALLHPPKLARSRVGSDGATAHLKIIKALAGDRSAEMEVRVAKLLVQEGETVTMAAEQGVDKTADLQTNRGVAEVKFSEGGTVVRLEGLILKGLQQIGDDGRLILVRATTSDIPEHIYLEVLEAKFTSWFGGSYPDQVGARPRLVDEADLPPLWTPPPKE